MKISKRKLKRIIREEYSRLKRRGLIKESNYKRDAVTGKTTGEGSLRDIINLCVEELQRDPDADLDTVCERWASMYGITRSELLKIKNAVWRRL